MHGYYPEAPSKYQVRVAGVSSGASARGAGTKRRSERRHQGGYLSATAASGLWAWKAKLSSR
jgi:hypothetical protein